MLLKTWRWKHWWNLAIHMCYADARSCKCFGTNAVSMLLMVSQKRGCVGQVPKCPLLASQRDHFTPGRLTVTKAFKDQQNRMPRALKSHLRLEARANLDWPHSLQCWKWGPNQIDKKRMKKRKMWTLHRPSWHIRSINHINPLGHPRTSTWQAWCWEPRWKKHSALLSTMVLVWEEATVADDFFSKKNDWL